MKTRKSLIAMIATVVVAGGALVVMRLPELSSWTAIDLAAMVALLSATIAGETYTLKFRFGAETKNVSLTEASYATALLLGVRPGVLMVAAVLGVAVAYAAKGTAPHKVAFNAGSFALSVGAAEAVYVGAHGASPLVAVALAMAAFFVVNAGTVVGVIALATGKSFVQVFAPIARIEFGHAGANLGLGLLASVVWFSGPTVVPALVVAAAISYGVYGTLAPRRLAIRSQ